jgi:SAM-dependent methyltransferase
VYGLQAHDLRVADAEHVPYPDNYFDCVYSWGVIHHSPDTVRCLEEIIRVTKPGGTIKIMVYNRHSLFALNRYVLYGLLKGKPFQTLTTVIFNHQESVGTKAYTFKEIRTMVARYPVTLVDLKAPVARRDLDFSLPGRLYRLSPLLRWLGYGLASLCGWNRLGWFMTIELRKVDHA